GCKEEWKHPTQWKLNSRLLKDTNLIEQTSHFFSDPVHWDRKKENLTAFLQDHSKKSHNKNKCLINRLQRKILGYEKTLTSFPKATDLRALIISEKLTLQKLIDE